MSDIETNTIDNISNETNTKTNELTATEKKQFKHFLWFFSGQQLSILGSSIVSFVLIWWISETTNSELMLGLAALASLGPFLIIAPFSGVIADRAKRKPLLVSVDTFQALFTVILTIIFMIYFVPNPDDPTAIENKTLLVTCVFITLGLRGAMQAFHSPTVNAMIPSMVPQKHLGRVNGASYLVGGIIQVAGPALGAVFLGVFGVSLTMWADGITFVIAVIPLLLIKIPNPIIKEKKERTKFVIQFKEGLQVINQTKGLFALMIGATLINFFFSPVSTLLPLFVSKTHFGTKGDYALVVSLLQAGSIIGALFMTFFKGFKNKIKTIVICISILFIGPILLIAVPPTLGARFWVIGIILFLAILPNPIANVSFSHSMQLIVPKEKYGRVSSVLMFMSMAITPIGTFLSGLIGEYVAHGILFTVSGALGLVIFIAIYLFTPARYLDKVLNEKISQSTNGYQEKESIEDTIEMDKVSREIQFVDKREEKITTEGAFK
ncbi:MAG: MFS transporter [Asgard group archaeon]|nr:MFS transporter [Asgard group archaeon]